jgi:hypothetical protein
VGLPKTIQSNQESNCISHIFQQVMHELNTKLFKSNAYYTESQVTLEIFCFDSHKDWDNGVRMLLFAVMETFQDKNL